MKNGDTEEESGDITDRKSDRGGVGGERGRRRRI